MPKEVGGLKEAIMFYLFTKTIKSPFSTRILKLAKLELFSYKVNRSRVNV
jgi:hypothetical protein